MSTSIPSSATDFISYVNASVSPYHAVAETERRLIAGGYTRLHEREAWDVKSQGKYYVIRNQSAIVAFAVGGRYDSSKGGFSIVGSHTDSPCLRVKASSSLTKSGYLSVGVETYGGGIWSTWLDRDLSVAGRAVVKKADGGYDSRLVRISRPILRVSSLAIHLNRDVNTEGMKLNAETQLAPMLATVAKALKVSAPPSTASSNSSSSSSSEASGAAAAVASTAPALGRHHEGLVAAISTELGLTSPEDLKDFDLSLYDTQPAAIGGLANEFIFAARLDNLMMTYCCFQALLSSTQRVKATASAAGIDAAAPAASCTLEEDTNVRIAAAFDHEECGSDSVAGAGSNFLEDVLARLCPDSARRSIALRKSILISADMAHAVHPNYPEKHAENLRPEMHKGLVLKTNANQRYATTSVTAFILRQIAAEAAVPVQTFTNRQDSGCGSTIGPIVSTRLGIRTVDIGIPQLSMHSAREVCGVDDAQFALQFFDYFYGRFSSLDASFEHAD